MPSAVWQIRCHTNSEEWPATFAEGSVTDHLETFPGLQQFQINYLIQRQRLVKSIQAF